ncbi:HEPN domain-containing protein [Synechococcus sp. CS-1325]|uniref:HEPN domain-containing protein n=1 Tax=Synechococcus sp. CS-1325 TaxID=2847979 RepID=UPI00223A74BE|nr:HEPN domain-containing protein [Synechococcus sp. CS-1325]
MHREPGNEDAVVFHGQQCLEKYFKAALIAHGEPVLKIHDLRELSRQLGILMPDWEADPSDLTRITQGGVMFRYPGMEASDDDAARAVGITQEVRQRLSGWLRTLPEVS